MIVLDTNVLVAGLRSRDGASFAILRLVIAGDAPFAVSVALALEYEDVLTREAQRRASWASHEDLEIVLNALLGAAVLAAPITTRIRPVLPDPGDEMVLECALQTQSDAIVTLNVRDFRGVEARFGIEVVTPGRWLSRRRQGSGDEE
jgi:putative PIN family toxin of toxin-antitoxin system